MFSKIMFISLIVLSFFVLTTKANKIYFIQNNKFKNWDAASLECKEMGLHLVSVKTKDELNDLKDYIQQEYGRIYPYWLGAYKVNGQYEWTATGEKISNFFWHEGEPNDRSGNEKCIHTWEEYFDWNDNDCERELPFICDLEV